jgi:hypothetical protein
MAPQKHLAVSANTTQVFSPEHRGICTALRCEANTSAFLPKGKHPSPPTLWHKETVSDKDADTPLGRAFQNECATRPCVAVIVGSAAVAGGGLALGLNVPFGVDAVQAQGAVTEVNIWVVIKPDDTCVIRIARSEMGQGTLTGIAQLDRRHHAGP